MAAAAAAAAVSVGGLDAHVVATLPTGVNLEYLRGPWMLDAADVKFETNECGRPRVLGHGASSIVFAGTYRTRPAAIKQVFPVTGGDVNAWLTEVQLQYRIRVEGVLGVYGAMLHINDDTGNLLYYIVMQRVAGCVASLVLTPGGTLQGANIHRRIRWLRQAAGALAALHAEGVIHGDVKPANIMLSLTDEAEAAALVAQMRSAGADTLATHRGERGSIVYMDPALFDGGSVTAASDSYSWAITAWQVLTGAMPYAAKLVAAAGVASEALALDTLRRHVCGATGQRPSVAVLAESGVPGAVIDMIQRCWDADAATRPLMAEVATALAAAMDTSVVGGHTTSPVVTAPHQPPASVPAVVAPLPATGPLDGWDAAELIVALSARDKARVVAGLKALAELESDAQRVRCIEEGAGVAARNILAGFAGDVEVSRAACGALRNLVCADGFEVQLVRDGAHAAVMAAACAHAGDVEVTRHACAVLRYLTFA